MSDCSIRRLGRPSREDSARLSDQVLASAALLFAERGYAETSMAAVAAHARVGKHTIYRRYPDKAELFRAVVRHKGEQLLGLPDSPDMSTGGCLASLEEFVMRIARALGSDDALWVFRIIVSEGARFPELLAVISKPDDDPVILRCVSLIRNCQAQGVLVPGNPRDIADVLLDLVATSVLHRSLASDTLDLDLDQIAKRGWAFFLRGAAMCEYRDQASA
jgi:AcrR family transcriptional regulator